MPAEPSSLTDEAVEVGPPLGALSIPIIRRGTLDEVGFSGLHQEAISVGDHGCATTTAGCGGDTIDLEWEGQHARVRYRDLLAAWVRQVDPKSHEALKAGIGADEAHLTPQDVPHIVEQARAETLREAAASIRTNADDQWNGSGEGNGLVYKVLVSQADDLDRMAQEGTDA
jgi:hypothetical protein